MLNKTKTSKSELTRTDYERIGRTIESVFESGYANHRRVYFINFTRGLFFGLGSVLGGTLVIAIVIWVLSLFTEVPLLGEFFEKVRSSIER